MLDLTECLIDVFSPMTPQDGLRLLVDLTAVLAKQRGRQ
jgi:hypothetical protein